MKGLILGITALLAFTGNGSVRMANGTYHADTQTVTDVTGNVWGYDTGLSDGTKVCVTFDTKGTENIYDDKIVEVRAW